MCYYCNNGPLLPVMTVTMDPLFCRLHVHCLWSTVRIRERLRSRYPLQYLAVQTFFQAQAWPRGSAGLCCNIRSLCHDAHCVQVESKWLLDCHQQETHPKHSGRWSGIISLKMIMTSLFGYWNVPNVNLWFPMRICDTSNWNGKAVLIAMAKPF